LVDWCFTPHQHKIGQFVPIYQGDYWFSRLRIVNEEHLKHTVACDTMNIHMQRQKTDMPYLLKDIQFIQQISPPRMGKKRKREYHNQIS